MKKIFSIVMALIIMLSSSACVFDYQEVSYVYNGVEYTSNCQYGDMRAFWNIKLPSETVFEEIAVECNGSKTKAKILKDDTNTDFFFVHDVLCVKKEISLPNVKENLNEIEYIEFDFLDKGTMIIDDKNDITRLAGIILAADSNTTQEKDISYSYDGNVNIYFKDFPLHFFAGRLVVRQDGAVFFSSSLNPQGLKDDIRKSWYSKPLNVSMETISKLLK